MIALLLLACGPGGDDHAPILGSADGGFERIIPLDATHAALVVPNYALLDVSNPAAPVVTPDWENGWWSAFDDGTGIWFTAGGILAHATHADLAAGGLPEQVRSFDHDLHCVAVDGDDLWVGSGNQLELWQGDTLAMTHDLYPMTLHAITPADGRLLIATTKGVVVFDPATEAIDSVLGRRETWEAEWDGTRTWVRIGGVSGATAWDLGDPTRPEWVGSVVANQFVRLVGDHLFSETAVYDVSDPSDPFAIATLPDADGWRDGTRVGDLFVRTGPRSTDAFDMPW